MNDHSRQYLSKLARLFRLQLRDQEGITILEGEGGTGKNVLIDQFAHFTNREVSTFSCNYQTEKEDIAYAFRFDPQRGTYQVDAEFIRRLQTPGSIIMLDEVNALPTGVAKMLNSLLDYRRCLHLPDGRVIKADPSVILVAAMNPQYYLGVKPLSQEFKSRARVLTVDYPPEKFPQGDRFAPYEAEMVAQWVPGLVKLSGDEFYALWDHVINRTPTPASGKLLTAEREKSLKDIALIVKTANRIREAHRAFRSGKSTDSVEFVFSLRESIQIINWLAETPAVKDAIKEVVLPKIADSEERDRVTLIIENV